MLDKVLSRKMEDLFFQQKEQDAIEARRELARMQETKENLAKVSGIQNKAVLEKLIALNIRPETLATLFVIPLVEVAWADGEMQEAEWKELFRHVEKAGLKNRKVDPKIVSAWLKQRPDPALMEAWEHYIQALSRQLSDEERQALKADLMADARAIAKAAGGLLGFGKISEDEQKVLDKLEAAFL